MLNQMVEYFVMQLSVPHEGEQAKGYSRDVQTENLVSQWKPHFYPDLYHIAVNSESFPHSQIWSDTVSRYVYILLFIYMQ